MIQTSSDPLEQAQVLLRKSQFKEVIGLLEPEIFRFRESPDFYYLLGLANLYLGDLAGAETYAKRANQLTKDDSNILSCLAAIQMMRGQAPEALVTLLSVQELNPAHKGARQALEALRQSTDAAALKLWLKSGGLALLTGLKAKNSRLKVPMPTKPLLIFGSVALVLASLFAAFPLIEPWFKTKDIRPGSAALELPRSSPLTSLEAKPEFLFNENQIREVFNLAKTYFEHFQDNLAMRELNRLLLSNASIQVKDKVNVFKTLIQKPDFVTFKDNFPYFDVKANPKLYLGCFVKWKGAVANLDLGKSVINFDFLIGYHEGQVLEGITKVTLNFPALIKTGQNLEILGQITDFEGDKLLITGLTIHEIGFRNPAP